MEKDQNFIGTIVLTRSQIDETIVCRCDCEEDCGEWTGTSDD